MIKSTAAFLLCLALGTSLSHITAAQSSTGQAITYSQQLYYFDPAGQVKMRPQKGGTFRKVLSRLPDGSYQVQHFYQDGAKKFSNPFVVKRAIDLALWIPNSLEGPLQIFYLNGQLWIEGVYQNGQRQGIEREWNEQGQLVREATYQHGLEQGIEKEWYANGQLWREVTYQNGLRHGTTKEWDESGKLTQQVRYENGSVVDY